MTGAQRHMVRCSVLEVELAGTERDGMGLQRVLADLCRTWLATALDKAFDGAVPENELWSIDRLTVDLGSLSLDRIEHEFADAVTRAVARQIRNRTAGLGAAPWRTERHATAHDAPRTTGGSPYVTGKAAPDDPSTSIRCRTDAEAVHETFVHFLATGTLPWWFRLPAGQTLEEAIVASWPSGVPPVSYACAVMNRAVAPVLRTRLVRQFSARFLDVLLESVSSEGARAVRAILARLERQELPSEMFRQLSEQLWLAAFRDAGAGAGTDSAIAGWLRQEASGTDRKPATPAAPSPDRTAAPSPDRTAAPSPDRTAAPSPDWTVAPFVATEAAATGHEAPAPALDLDEGVYVECAGLVLLHPFLPRLFEALGIAAGDALVRPDRALGVMHFLATGEPSAPEYTLVLPKMLCNLPLGEPADAPTALTTGEKDEAMALLQVVIDYWEALGNASVDALRGTFLTRPGKLSRRGEDDLLQVEPQSFDILLDRLPWSIGAVRLPWMTRILWIEWTP